MLNLIRRYSVLFSTGSLLFLSLALLVTNTRTSRRIDPLGVVFLEIITPISHLLSSVSSTMGNTWRAYVDLVGVRQEREWLRRRVREEIRELQQDLNLTVAYVTHDQEEALAVSDRIIVMSNARIAQEGAPRDLYEQPSNAFVADFIGDANLVDVTVKAAADGRADVAIGSATVSLPARGLGVGPAKVAIRPEALLLSEPGQGGSLPGTIRKCAYLGNHLDVMVETEVGELFVVQYGGREMLAPGSPVSVSFANKGVTLIPPA